MNIFNKQLDNLNIGLIDKKSTIFMADAGYDSIKLWSKLNNIFYKSIIPFNKRNTKDKNKIKTLTNEEKKLYKSRFEIVYEKNLKIFEFNLLIINKICNLNNYIYF